MLKLGKIRLGDSPKIAATVGDLSPKTVKKIKECRAHILELRLDEVRKIDAHSISRILKIVKSAKLPVICTIRSLKEGGKQFIPAEMRLQLFKMVIPEVDGVDVELGSTSILNSVIKFAHKFHKLVIVSYHNFNLTPTKNKLEGIIKEARRRKADIVKISTLARSVGDILTLGSVTHENRKRNIITLAMGKTGAISRVFLPLIGSLVTYGFVDRPHAPGQLSVKTLKQDFKKYIA